MATDYTLGYDKEKYYENVATDLHKWMLERDEQEIVNRLAVCSIKSLIRTGRCIASTLKRLGATTSAVAEIETGVFNPDNYRKTNPMALIKKIAESKIRGSAACQECYMDAFVEDCIELIAEERAWKGGI